MADKWDWNQPKWWWVVVFAVGGLTAIAIPQCNRWQDARQQAVNRRQDQWNENQKEQRDVEREKPRLTFIGIDGPRNDGFTHIKYQNASGSQNAVVRSMELTITDPRQLQLIERAHPRPLENQAGAPFDKDEVRLVHGAWQGPYYIFYVSPDLYIAPNQPHDFLTCIVDPLLPPTDFCGTFTIDLQNGDSDSRDNITIRSRRR